MPELEPKSELIYRIKNLAIDPYDFRYGKELLKLMDYYGVDNLISLSVEQLEEYYKMKCKEYKLRYD